MRPRLTPPIAELNSPQSAQEARPRVLCALRNVRRPPGPSHAGPSPRAAGAPFHVGRGSPGQSALPPPQRIAGSYASFQPLGGLTSGVPRHHGAAVPPALPHDRQVRNASPGSPIWPGGWKQPCLRPRLGIPPCRSSGGGWKTRFISPWQNGILLPIPARGAAG